ncbi:hypothetical protein ELQ87_09620 [Streptomyces griseoviridis]|uniref:Uncharacterized protein n=1 Tax=Streptomyces griseoviridis TaxID=45398 RepID=A0A3Q9KU69_STRGD|nr:hypothetical protein [Streptomyces griseoviridis]AZS84513.1 hypothetical protein ELQ87_09620 [Streptomyces griseoviridis]QCN88630.1 hypothetical protein DDJ31_29695 [Streptomyces griseoviridis]
MRAQHQDVSLLRRLYTGESVQQARRAVDGLQNSQTAIPETASPAQQFLEARVLVGLLEFRNLYTRFPLGISAVQPRPDVIGLGIESEERAAEILFNLLPSYVPAHNEVHGVPGLRITRRHQTAIELQVLGESARLRLTGLPSTLWRSAEERALSNWVDADSMHLCWRSSPRAWTAEEREHHARWENPDDQYVQVKRRGAWLGSGLLRRAALLHTVANTFMADGHHSAAFGMARLVLQSSHARAQGPGPHNVVAALLDPVCGLPLELKRYRGDTDENYGSDQQFVLEDAGKTAVLDLRAAVERPPSLLAPELWQAIVRRMPRSGFTSGLSPSVLAGFCSLGAA